MIEGLENIRAIAWDFDGVLNRDRIGKTFPWHTALKKEFGVDLPTFVEHVFRTNPRAWMTGKEDVLDRLEDWAKAVDFEGDAEDVLELWLRESLDLNPELELIMEQISLTGITQVVATNNEARRARTIRHDAGLSAKADAIFASGEMGAMKPEPEFFEQIETALGLAPQEILLIDDGVRNISAAEKRGWLGWQYEEDGQMDLAKALMPLMLLADEAGESDESGTQG